MGMPVVVDVRDPAVPAAAVADAFAWLRWVDETFSTYRADSEVARLNRGELA
jgi:FAD:protein FMN transferase